MIERYHLGTICNPASIASAVMQVLEPQNHARFRANSLKARDELTWEGEEQKLIALYRSILG